MFSGVSKVIHFVLWLVQKTYAILSANEMVHSFYILIKKIICIKRLKRGEHLTLSNAKGEKFVRDKTSWKVISEILFGICANRSPSKSQMVQVRSFWLVTFNDFREDKKPFHSIEILMWCHIVFSDSSLCRIWAIKIAYFSEKQQLLSSAKGNSLLTRTTFTIYLL